MQGGPLRQGQEGQGAARFKLALAVLTVIAFTAPAMPLLGLSEDPNLPPNPALRLYWPPVYALTLLLCLRSWRDLRRAWFAALLVGLPVCWAVASQLWSIMPDDTGRRAIALVMTTLFGVVLGSAFSGERMVKVIAAACVVLAGASAVMALALPQYGVEQLVNVGCWRGLWDTKNALAAFMTIGALASACAASLPGAHRRRWLVAFGLCGFDLLMSRGKTSLVCLLLGLALLAVFSLARKGPARAVMAVWAAGAALLVSGFVAFIAPEVFFKAIGKDPTLTGRTEIWTAVLAQVAQRPLTGFGFAAFWGKQSVPAQIIAKQTGWPAPEAHNGWLDLLAQVGGVGAGLAALACLVGVVYGAATMSRRDDGDFSAIYIVIFLAMSLAESVLLSPNGLIWVVFVAALTQVLRPHALDAPSDTMQKQVQLGKPDRLAGSVDGGAEGAAWGNQLDPAYSTPYPHGLAAGPGPAMRV